MNRLKYSIINRYLCHINISDAKLITPLGGLPANWLVLLRPQPPAPRKYDFPLATSLNQQILTGRARFNASDITLKLVRRAWRAHKSNAIKDVHFSLFIILCGTRHRY